MTIKTGHHQLLLLISFMLICLLTVWNNDKAQAEQLQQTKIQPQEPPVDLPVSPFRLLQFGNNHSHN